MTITSDQKSKRVCDICGKDKGLKQFLPTSEEPKHKPIFCEMCFMSDDVNSEEPITKSEKAEMWLDADNI